MKVKPHTSLKHRMLGAYFFFCRQIMRWRTLYYADLYAGSGECECEGGAKKEGIKPLTEHWEKNEENKKEVPAV